MVLTSNFIFAYMTLFFKKATGLSISKLYLVISHSGLELPCSLIMLSCHGRYESSWGLLGNEYFTHASGALYALSSEVVGALAIAKNDRLAFIFFPIQ